MKRPEVRIVVARRLLLLLLLLPELGARTARNTAMMTTVESLGPVFRACGRTSMSREFEVHRGRSQGTRRKSHFSSPAAGAGFVLILTSL